MDVTVGGLAFPQAKTTFKVFRPNVDFETRTANPIIFDAKKRMQAVAIFDRTLFDIPAGFQGNTLWVQIVTATDIRRQMLNGDWEKLNTSPGLDTTYPYGQDAEGDTNDFPSSPLDEAMFKSMYRDDGFKMYLMFKPEGAGAIAVPLRVVTWSWTGLAQWNPALQPPPGRWELIQGSCTPNPVEVDTFEFPVWDHNANDDLIHEEWLPSQAP